jgi:putative ATP-dependent endonuclease of OLD family
MKIKEIKIENFKGFKDVNTFDVDSDMIFVVGENNSGKSSLFEAVNFVQNGIPKGKKEEILRNKSASANANVGVTLILQGRILDVIEAFSQPKFKEYIYTENHIETLKIRRQTEKTEWTDSRGKIKELTVKDIGVWSSSKKEYQNPSGISPAFKTLLESQFIWADTNPDDVSSFVDTKICGKLIKLAAGDFFTSKLWQDFKKLHKKTFTDGPNSLSKEIGSLEEDIRLVLDEQYGPTGVSFSFDIPDESSFIKMGDIELDDGVKTGKGEKGDGMQRALALALIQVYAKSLTAHPEREDILKPLFFFIDEPETFLHPRAQSSLVAALDKISKSNQIFITTHSPYLLRGFNKLRHKLVIFKKDKTTLSHTDITSKLGLFGKYSPSWGEINYLAYNIATNEFHNELYGRLQAIAIAEDNNNYSENKFDNYLRNQIGGTCVAMDWIKILKDKDSDGLQKTKAESRTLQTFIRNSIHHPENNENLEFTDSDLHKSIDQMVELLRGAI